MSPNPRTCDGNQQGSVSSPARRLDRKTEKLLRLFEDHVFTCHGEKTAKTMLARAQLFLAWLEERGTGLVDVRTADVEAYQVHVCALRQKDGTPYSIPEQTYRLAHVKTLFRFLYRRGYVLTDPSAAVEYPRPEKRLPRTILTREEARKLVEACDTSSPEACAIAPSSRSSTAPGSARARWRKLKTTDVDVEDRILRVVLGKGSRDRNVPLTRAAADATERVPRGRRAEDPRCDAVSFPLPCGPWRSDVPVAPQRGRAATRRRRRGSRSTSPATRCGTRSRRISSRAAPTSGTSRRCSATPRSTRPSATRTSRSRTSRRS